MKLAFFELLAALLVVGCGGDDLVRCTTSADCPSGRCVDGTCRPGTDGAPGECSAAADCDDGDACNGTESCAAGMCRAGSPAADGTACGSSMLCIDGGCAPTRCGDAFVDATASEECDDGNDVSGDGCDACRFGCTEDTPCDDAEECNGIETCLVGAHRCEPGTALADGTDCASGIGVCTAGRCLPRMCTEATECSDADVCTGDETCASMMCAAGIPLDCDDEIACTADSCSGAIGCVNRLVDMDFDGHPPSELGACGDDCNDDDPAIFTGAGDGCDGMDNDCDMAIDEDEALVWFADCDGDSYAVVGATSITACAEPIPSLSGCATGGDFTARAPADAANTDCVDTVTAANPAQTSFQTTAIAGVPPEVDFDYNCNGVEEQQQTALGTCRPVFGSICVPNTPGWVGAVPECGATGMLTSTCTNLSAGCRPLSGPVTTQACR